MKKMMKGLTLIELMMGMAIFSIILGWGVPSFSHQINNSKLYAEQQQITTLINAARLGAVRSQHKVTICPSSATDSCSDSWSRGYLAFIDINGDRILDSEDKIIYQYQTLDKKMNIRWRAFGNQKTLQWLTTGMTNHQNGSFEICLDDDPKYARALVLSKMGRLRTTKDTDGDGIRQNSRGDNIQC